MKLIRLERKSLWNHIKYLNEIRFFDFRFIDKHFIIIFLIESFTKPYVLNYFMDCIYIFNLRHFHLYLCIYNDLIK